MSVLCNFKQGAYPKLAFEPGHKYVKKTPKNKKNQNIKIKKQVYAKVRGERFYTKNSKYKSPEI